MMEKEYEIEFFHENNFVRRYCKSCGRAFWSLGESETCGETPCQEYTFIGKSPMSKKLTPSEMREEFLSFLESRDHKRIRRYPIVARWRDDVFYTQASIYPFQPWVIGGVAKPPANPLAISQTCVRFNDIDNVGKTGQHFTMFEMMAHHAFNTKDQFIYFKDRTVELCHEFLTRNLGVDPNAVTYAEAWWEGGGNSGPCFEVILGGAELATLVFMVNREENGRRVPMDTQVVDTGYGLERFAWVSQGTPSAYEAVFGEVLTQLKNLCGVKGDEKALEDYSKIAGMMKVETLAEVKEVRRRTAERIGISLEDLIQKVTPMENLYLICDHARALMFILNDGVVPSNVKEGYFARLLVRRAMRALDVLGLKMSLADVISMQINYFKRDFPELLENEKSILKLIEVEQTRYKETLSKGRGIVGRLESQLQGRSFDVEKLVELYDSHGLNPEVVREFAKVPVEIPEDFYKRVAARHEPIEEERKVEFLVPEGTPPTRLRVYEDRNKKRFMAKVLDFFDNAVILDQTYFYPEGGGQEADWGEIGPLIVVDVQKVGNVVLHLVKGTASLQKGKRVRCSINWERRENLMRNHTATHIIMGAARRVLGNHVWQTGAHKGEELARLDITHYNNLSKEEYEQIERMANEVVLSNLRVSSKFMERDVAESKFGFRLYQGGCVPGKEIRVVEIPEWDAEACGGTHCSRTSEVGLIKLLRTRRIQDGVLRIEYAAGRSAVDQVQKQSKAIEEMSSSLGVLPELLPSSVERFYKEWKEFRKEVERLKEEEATIRVKNLLLTAEEVSGVKVAVYSAGKDMKDLMVLAKQLISARGVVAILGAKNSTASLLIARSADVDIDCSKIIEIACQAIEGRGGGKTDFAQGGGAKVEGLEEGLKKAKEEVVLQLRGLKVV